MNIPTPAAVKKLTDARKEREAELASSLATAKDKMPDTKGSSKRSSKRNGDTASTPSISSPKGKGSQDHTSKKATSRPKASTNSTSSSRPSTASSRDIRKERSSTSTTTRKNSSTPSSENSKKSSPDAKKSFVRPDHLTTKPLRNNEALLGLKKSLEKPARGQFKREYRVGGRRSGKSQALQNKKENS